MTDVSLAPVVAFGAATLSAFIPSALAVVGAFAVYEVRRFTGFQISKTVAAEVEKFIADEALLFIKSEAPKLEKVAIHAGSDQVTEIVNRIFAVLPAQLRKLGWSEPVIATKLAAAIQRGLAALEAAPPKTITPVPS